MATGKDSELYWHTSSYLASTAIHWNQYLKTSSFYKMVGTVSIYILRHHPAICDTFVFIWSLALSKNLMSSATTESKNDFL